MEKKMLTELQGLLEDINQNEIVFHILDGTLLSWMDNWKMKVGMLVAFLLEKEEQNMGDFLKTKIRPLICGDGYDTEARLNGVIKIIEKELEKLRRENFELKNTVENLRRQLDMFYHYR